MNFRGFLLIALSILASIYTVLDGGYRYISYNYPTVSTSAPAAGIVSPFITEPVTDSSDSTDGQVVKQEPANTETESEARPVAAVGTAKGKIISEFISPYSANTKYGKVYLKNSTGTDIDLAALLKAKCGFTVEKNSEPQVLIMHTHTTESYIHHDSDYYTENDEPRSLDDTKNMIAIGNIFEQKLTAAGIGVIHDTTVHDYPSYSGSYTRSANTVTSDLKAYPSVKIVIDIHRDSIARDADKVKPVVEINGKKAAQVMLVMGSQTGTITDFPKWQENLKFAVKYQEKMEEMYSGLARAMMLNSGKYNQNLSVGSILLEVGTDGNTLSEAKLGAELAADALISLLSTMN